MGYGMILTFMIFSFIFTVGAIIANRLLMPSNPGKIKNATYECGVDPQGAASTIRYKIGYYTFAFIYVIFAVETIFLFPWAVVYNTIPGFLPFIEILIFLFVLISGFAYAWKKGALQWA